MDKVNISLPNPISRTQLIGFFASYVKFSNKVAIYDKGCQFKGYYDLQELS